MKFKQYLIENSFEEIKKKLVDDTMKYTKSEEYDVKSVKKLYKINDPKKFVTAYKRLTGARDSDLPKGLREDKKQVKYYINKWNTKMKGYTVDVATDWVKGIKELSAKEKAAVMKGIILGEDKIEGGMADKKKPEDFDQKELKMGIKIEMEHTDDADLAKEIAMDHLTEIPTYYSKLIKMEKEAKNGIV